MPTYRVDATVPKYGHVEVVSAHSFDAETLAKAIQVADDWAINRKFARPKITAFRLIRADMILAERPVDAKKWTLSSR